jgi:glucose/arabinose dehydrogenase
LLLLCLTVLSSCAADAETENAHNAPFDWRSDWAVKENFTLTIDSEGYHFPTALAFVPHPGQGPKDPLYFVTALRGTVHVVTNDRTVYTFAEGFFHLTPKAELPAGEGQTGLAGICLDPKRGYVFVTFAYQDEKKALRNNIIRFQSIPEVFSLQPTSHVAFTEVFAAYESGLSHQIGSCQIRDDLLYVSVGESWQPFKSQQLDTVQGKILRMTLDGKPVPDNPFYQNEDVNNAANYVWAYGLRNPFGLKLVGGQMFVADNGAQIDRFLEVQKGKNYLWDGNDWSIATNAAFILTPSHGVAQLDYCAPASCVFPQEYEQTFFVGLTPEALRGGRVPGILALQYGLGEHKMLGVPEYFLKHRSKKGEDQMVAGLAFGPDGLYFAPLFPNQEGRSPILKITYDPAHPFPFTLVQNDDPVSLMRENGCLGCHTVNDRWGYGGAVGPPLGGEAMVARIQKELNSEKYLRSLTELDLVEEEPYRSFKEARREVVTAQGTDKIRTWIKYRLQEPRFDRFYSQMPSFGLSDTEALIIADYLLPKKNGAGFARGLLPRSVGYKHVLLSFVGGFFTALGLLVFRRLIK